MAYQHPRFDAIRETDPAVADLIVAEAEREATSVRLIASENYASEAVMAATGSAFTNKYSEGYGGKRYYEGQQVVDQVEALAIDRATTLFGADHANVQPYSGSPANLAVYLAFATPGDTILGLGLAAGGHLTHGHKVSATGKWFNAVHYGVRKETGRVDLDDVRELALEHRPTILFCGGTAVPRTIDFEGFAQIAAEVDALLVADIAHIAGLVAGGAHPTPIGHAPVVTTTTHKSLRGPRGAMILTDADHAKAIDRAVFPGLQGGPHNHTTAAMAVALAEAATPAFKDYAAQIVANARALGEVLSSRGLELVSGGTDNHLLLVDLTPTAIGGKPAAQALDRAGIVCNYNAVPFDPRPPFDPSGLRLGTPAMTSRGMGTDEMAAIGNWIVDVVEADGDTDVEARVRDEVSDLVASFPAPGITV